VMALATAKDLGIPVLVSVRALPRLEYESLPLRIAMRYYFPKAAGVILQTRGAKSFFPKKSRKVSDTQKLHKSRFHRQNLHR